MLAIFVECLTFSYHKIKKAHWPLHMLVRKMYSLSFAWFFLFNELSKQLNGILKCMRMHFMRFFLYFFTFKQNATIYLLFSISCGHLSQFYNTLKWYSLFLIWFFAWIHFMSNNSSFSINDCQKIWSVSVFIQRQGFAYGENERMSRKDEVVWIK